MLASEIKAILVELQSQLGHRAISIRCKCENLEMVDVSLDERGQVSVSDDHRTFQYLERSDDSTYVAMEEIDLAEALAVCAGHGAMLVPADEDGFPLISYIPMDDESINDAIAKVASAVEAVFQLAMIPSLRDSVTKP